MKVLSKSLAVLILLALFLAPGLVRAQDDSDDQGVSFQNFYDQLGDQGNWIQTDDYGYVFQPNVSDPNWAPYSDGHWVYTDEGWTWVSDEPWGWATYHYGRWANIDGTGWVWVPGYRWAPAWVSWRYGGGYCGWAPLPPETFIGAEYGDPGINIGFGFHFGGDVDVNFNIGPGCYNFVSIGDLGESNYRGRYIDRSRNYTVINNTTNITNININKTVNNYGTAGAAASFRGVVANGPPINEVNAHSRQPVPTVQLTEASQPGQSRLQGNSLAVYAPKVNAASAKDARPARVSQTLAHPTFNRGDSITKPLAVSATVRPPAPSAEAIQAAKTAQAHIPAKAHIATTKTRIKTTLTKPLTSMAPVNQLSKTPNPTASTNSNAAGSAYTGESVKPKTETEAKPATTYHPEEENKPATTYHPEEENKPATTYHPEEEKPATTYHPEEENKPAPTYHPEEEKPATTYHPQSQGGGGGGASHPEASGNHSAPSGGKPSGGQAKPQGGGNAKDNKNPGQ